VLKLTPRGRTAFAQMAAVHQGWVADLFGDVSPDDKARMIALLDTMKRQLNVQLSDKD